MKSYQIYAVICVCLSLFFIQCQEEDFDDKPIYQDQCNDGIKNGDEIGIDCGGSNCPPCEVANVFDGDFFLKDQMGRPGVNMVFNSLEYRDSLNVVLPAQQNAIFKDIFKQRLMAMDSTYTTNVLGLDADQMAGIFAADVLWVAAEGPTEYYGTAIMTGRNIAEDVMDANLLWIFGGPNGTKNNDDPLLISDGVDTNDAPFLNEFPYLPLPFE